MMHWKKMGLIFNTKSFGDWRDNTFITPVPYLLSSEVIRIFGGFRDKDGVSRIGYIDVDAADPKKVLRVSQNPVLDIGKSGMFDDNGVILGSIISDGDDIRMYYVGFQMVKKVKFLAFTGLAISTDKGESFQRASYTPVMDRFGEEHYIRAIHTVIKENGIYRIWYSAGNKWEYINDTPYPQYKIMYTESTDGINIPAKAGISCIDVKDNEYRIGRPVVFKEDGIYKMFYTRDTLDKIYSAGYAESSDGIQWERNDAMLNLPLSSDDFDSETVCYPVPLQTSHGNYVFYSGNGMGKTGVGFAIRKENI